MAEQPKISIQEKDKSPTEPLDQKPMTLEEARALDKQTGGVESFEKKQKTAPVPRRDYTQTPTPPPDLGIADNEDPTRIVIDFNRFGQISDITFSGQAALIATAGRFRSMVGTIITRAGIARARQHQDRIIANEKRHLENDSRAASKKSKT